MRVRIGVKKQVFLAMILVMLTLPREAAPDELSADDKDTSGLPVPRFASLRSGDVNMRTGPGTRYPIEWVYTRHGLPVEIIAEYEIWRRIRDPDGTEGWVHKISLTGKRMAMVMGAQQELRRDQDDQAPIIAHLEPGSLGQLVACAKEWCKLKFDGPQGTLKGYLRKTQFWGAYPNDLFD